MSPQDIVTYGAGIMALVIIFGIFWARHQGEETLSKQQQKAIDDRDATIKELHQRNREISDRYHDSVQGHSSQILATVESMRREHGTAIATVSRELSEAKADLAHCMAKHEECDKNVSDLRELIAKHIATGA